jgi:hypothetical protein
MARVQVMYSPNWTGSRLLTKLGHHLSVGYLDLIDFERSQMVADFTRKIKHEQSSADVPAAV